MHGFWLTVHVLLSLYTLVLIVRLVFEVVKSLARDWHPKGLTVLLLEAVFTVTDPPIKLLRRIIPPVRLGQIRLDLSMLIVFIAIGVLERFLPW